MEFENFKALRQWVWSEIREVWRQAPEVIDRAVIAAGRLLTAEFWIALPGRVAQMIWNGIPDVLYFLRRTFDAITRNQFVRRVTVGFLAFVVIGWCLLAIAAYLPSRQVAPSQPEYKIYYLEQGWGPSMTSEDRQTFYYTPQGTSLLATGFRYSWFKYLEQNLSKKRFIEPGHMRALGFQVDNVPTPKDPDNLPVGFTRHFAPEFNDEVLDITCAACHTGELFAQVKGEYAGIRIDGGQGMHAFTSTSFGQFGTDLSAAMAATLLHPFKFRRFAQAVLGERYPAAAPKLYWDFLKVMGSLLSQTISDGIHNRYPVDEGFGRTDAIGRIANRAFGTDLDDRNFAPGNAPVSYPAIWTAHQWDWVQYGASVAQPMARNIGESLGVGATVGLVDDYGRPLADSERFVSGTLIRNLKTIEDTIAKLKAPEWPEELLGPVVQKKADKGKILFEQTCAHCHEPCWLPKYEVAVERPLLLKEDNPALKEDQQLWKVNTVPVADIGTDPQAAMNFVNRKINLEKTGLTRQQVMDKVRVILQKQEDRKKAAFAKYGCSSWSAKVQCGPDPGDGQAEILKGLDKVNLTSTTIGQALNYADIFIRDKYYKELGIDDRTAEEFDGEGALDTPEVNMVYKARPLGGVWATAPYLHNGSVPTLYDLLSPANERPRRFFIRSRMDFDPVRVGLVSSPASDKGFWLDTTIPGNRNTGHEFRGGYSTWTENSPPSHGVIGPEWTPEERWQIIEYLKIYKENPPPCAVETAKAKPAQVTQR